MGSFSDWPWQYSFPPFFTVQPNSETRRVQLKAWTELVLTYCRHEAKFVLDSKEAQAWPLFSNQQIQRSLSSQAIQQVMEELEGRGGAAGLGGGRYLMLWHSVAEWASILYSWAVSCGHTNSVCTLYEIVTTPDQEFTDMDQVLLLKILAHLEKDNSAELITLDATKGVKFF